MDYRKFYEQQTKVKLPKNFEVHHIDLNRDNSEIENLVAIPKDLHNSYHTLLQETNIAADPITIDSLIPQKDISKGFMYLEFRIDSLNEYLKQYKELQKWIIYREYLLGNILYNISKKSYK